MFKEFLYHDWFKVVGSANRPYVRTRVTGQPCSFFLPITANICSSPWPGLPGCAKFFLCQNYCFRGYTSTKRIKFVFESVQGLRGNNVASPSERKNFIYSRNVIGKKKKHAITSANSLLNQWDQFCCFFTGYKSRPRDQIRSQLFLFLESVFFDLIHEIFYHPVNIFNLAQYFLSVFKIPYWALSDCVKPICLFRSRKL